MPGQGLTECILPRITVVPVDAFLFPIIVVPWLFDQLRGLQIMLWGLDVYGEYYRLYSRTQNELRIAQQRLIIRDCGNRILRRGAK